MAVDPQTGLPIPEQRGRPQSTVGMYGSAMGENYGVQAPLFYDLMEAFPTAATTVSWNMARTRSTILANRTGSLATGGLRQTFSPFRFNTFSDLSNIDPEFFGTTRKARGFWGLRGSQMPDGSFARPGYTPFNFLSRTGNWAAGRKIIPEQYRMTGSARAFAPGTFGTMSTMASINAGSYSAERMGNVIGAANRFSNAPMGPGGRIASTRFASVAGNQTYAATTIGATRLGGARYSGNVAGYFQGAQAARMGTVGEMKAGLTAARGGGYFATSARRAVTNYGGEGSRGAQMLARAAGSRGASLGLRAVPFVGKAMLAYDITRGLGMVAGRGAKLVFDSYKSAQGDLNKRGPMGMGYVDNSVAATSRQRGVMAISNSRLNARSFLGQEAAYVHQNFG